VSEYESKRRRLSSEGNISPQSARHRPSSPPAETNERSERKPVRPRGGGEEDRKRGQRLFGGLLGTLSQKPTNAAQRRRADIEKKQQEKLKTQDVEYGELKKRRKEQREEIRRREKPLYEREVVCFIHLIFSYLWKYRFLTDVVLDADAAYEYDRHGTLPQNTDRTRSGELLFTTQY
jgi:hypothetical protein